MLINHFGGALWARKVSLQVSLVRSAGKLLSAFRLAVASIVRMLAMQHRVSESRELSDGRARRDANAANEKSSNVSAVQNRWKCSPYRRVSGAIVRANVISVTESEGRVRDGQRSRNATAWSAARSLRLAELAVHRGVSVCVRMHAKGAHAIEAVRLQRGYQ